MSEPKTEIEIVADALDEIIESQEELNNNMKSLNKKLEETNTILSGIKSWITFFGVLAVIGIILAIGSAVMGFLTALA